MTLLSTSADSVSFKQLTSIPSLMDMYKAAFKDVLPVVGTSRVAKGLPSAAYEVKGVTVDRDHLADYCASTGLRLSNELPYTYPYVLTFSLVLKVVGAPDSPVQPVGMVHLSNEIEQTRPLTVDDTLDVRVYGAQLRRHKRGVLLEVVTIVSVDGEDVWKQTSGFLSKGMKIDKSSALQQQEPTDGRIVEAIAFDEDTATAYSRSRVTGSDIKVYAEASGDKNPIHMSNVGAKAFGFPAAIAHGMWTAAHTLAKLEGTLPPAARYKVEFAKPVVLPANIAYFVQSAGDGAYPIPSKRLIQVRSAKKLSTLHMNASLERL